MGSRRVTLQDLDPAQPLAMDLLDMHGWPVLNAGQIPNECAQFALLLQQGLYFSGDELGEISFAPSVLRLINGNIARLQKLLPDMTGNPDAVREIKEIAEDLHLGMQINTDIALASIFLAQIAGTYAVRHSIETAIVAMLLAQASGKTEKEIMTLACAALTMNVGMLDMHDQLQHRSMLSREEQNAIRRHPEQSVSILRRAGVEDEDWLQCVLHHHENDDGSGYPFGKQRDEIPPNARWLALADRYCAQVSARNYRKSMLPAKAMEALARDTEDGLFQTIVKEIGPYPPGTFVRLQNGELGVVSQRGDTAPVVHALQTSNGESLLPTPPARDAADPACRIEAALHEDEAEIRVGMKQIWGEQASL